MDWIENEAVREACIFMCATTNSARMSYAIMRNNEEARKQEQVGPQAFTNQLPSQ